MFLLLDLLQPRFLLESGVGENAKRHPGPWRVMRVDSEFAGILLAVGFLVMGLVSMPVGTGFVLGAITLGVVVALLLRFTPKKFSRVVLGIVISSLRACSGG